MTSNKLKIVAVIFMLIDHFAYYFYYAMPSEVYTLGRILGRMSMPIFVYLLVQGYFNTKNIKIKPREKSGILKAVIATMKAMAPAALALKTLINSVSTFCVRFVVYILFM